MGQNSERRWKLIDRALEMGIPDLRDEDIYELLLAYCDETSNEEDIRKLALKLYKHFGGFQRLSETSMEELMYISGMKEPQARLLRLTALICERGEEQRELAVRLSGPRAAGRFLVSKFSRLEHEVTVAACLDEDFRCVRCNIVAQGDAFSTVAEPYDIAAEILRANTGMVILAHNHVTGGPEPSPDDLYVTDFLLRHFRTARLLLLDHIIVSGYHYVSLAANGYFRGENEAARGRYCPDPMGESETPDRAEVSVHG